MLLNTLCNFFYDTESLMQAIFYWQIDVIHRKGPRYLVALNVIEILKSFVWTLNS